MVKLTFFESVDLFTLYQLKQKKGQLQVEVQQRKDRIEEIRNQYEALNNAEERERFAREKYLFKKDNEVIFMLSNK